MSGPPSFIGSDWGNVIASGMAFWRITKSTRKREFPWGIMKITTPGSNT
ncbi:hypothetical protein O5282_00015 [Escherichia coli]|nr:hypothetical protein [Escherichia coli]